MEARATYHEATALSRITRQGKERGAREMQEWLPFRNYTLAPFFHASYP
jgi:hypothetical protein